MTTVVNRLKELDVTQATKFVLPMLYLPDRGASFFITKLFENCFIGDANHPELGKGIFLLYNYEMSVNYVKFESSLELISHYSTDYDYSSERQVMYVFNVPEEHKEDFEHFLNGKYTLFSEELKQKILAFWGVKKLKDGLHTILYTEDNVVVSDKDSEALPKPDLQKEIYTSPK